MAESPSRLVSKFLGWALLITLWVFSGCQEDSPTVPGPTPPPSYDVKLCINSTLPASFPPFTMAQEHVYYYKQNTLYCLDISDPATPFETSSVEIPDVRVTLLKTIDDRLFVGVYGSNQQPSLQIFDIANPAEPTLLGECFLSSTPIDLTAKGNNLYLTAGAGLVAVNIENPIHPVVGTRTQSTYPIDLVAVVGDSLFAHEEIFRSYSFDSGISTWDITTPQTPSLISFTDTLWGVKAFESDGARLIFNEGSTLHVWDPSISSDFRSGGLFEQLYFSLTDLDFVDGFAYFAFFDFGIKIVDTQDIDHLVEIGSYRTENGVDCIEVSSTRMCINNLYGDLEIFELNSPSDPQLRSRILTLPIGRKGLAVEGNIAFVTGGFSDYPHDFGRLAILDISNPSAAQVISVLDSDIVAYDIVVTGNRAFVSFSDFSVGSEIVILDITDPSQPTKLGVIQGQGHIPVFTAAGDLLFSAGDGFQILDVSSPESPLEISRMESSDPISGILVKDGFAYICAGNTFQIFDVNDPAAPIALGSAETRGETLAIAMAGSFVYLSEGGGDGDDWLGLEIFDISEPGSPNLVGSLRVVVSYKELCISGDYVFAPRGVEVDIINIADPTAPYVAGVHPLGASFASSDGQIFMMSNEGFSVVNLEPLTSGK